MVLDFSLMFKKIKKYFFFRIATNHLLNLNFDCLLKIVSYLNIGDMLILKTTYPKDGNIQDAVNYSESKIKHLDFGLLENETQSVQDTLLQKMGPNLTSLEYKCLLPPTASSPIFMLRRYCSNITTLKLDLCPLYNKTEYSCLTELAPKNFPNLMHVTLKGEKYQNFDNILKGLVNLKTLRISGMVTQDWALSIIGKKIKTLTLIDTAIDHGIVRRPFFDQSSNYDNLREVCLTIAPSYNLTGVLNIHHLPLLEKITFKLLPDDKRFPDYPRNEKKIFHNICLFLKRMARVDILRYFCVDGIVLPTEAYRELSKFKNLQVLNTTSRETSNSSIDNEVLEIIGGYEELTELHMEHSSKFTYEVLEKIIRRHPKLKLLNISHSEIYFKNGPVDIPETPAAHWRYFCRCFRHGININKKDDFKFIYADYKTKRQMTHIVEGY